MKSNDKKKLKEELKKYPNVKSGVCRVCGCTWYHAWKV